MKKKLPLITFIITIVILVVGFLSYQKYIKSKMDNITMQSVTVNCSKNPQQLLLIKHPDQTGIFQLELTIEGNSTKNLNIQIGSSANQMTSDIRIKKGEIETAYINDWYTDSAFVKIDSDNNAHGKITLSYQFIGMDAE